MVTILPDKRNLIFNAGFIICLFAFLIYFLLKLPLNLSILCTNENQGFGFIFGQDFLSYHRLSPGRGPIYILLYAGIIRFFGFNTYSIIAVHWLETILAFSTIFLIFLIVRKVTNNLFFSGLSSLFWVLLVLTPIGGSESIVELRSQFSFTDENLCVLFSLLSIYFLLKGRFFNIGNCSVTEKAFLFFGGFFAVCSSMSKSSGTVLCIVILTFIAFLLIFKRSSFVQNKLKIIYSLLGMFFGFGFFILFMHFLEINLLSFWKNYFLIGSYTHEHLIDLKVFLQRLIALLTRSSNSASNFIFFSVSIVLFLFSTVRVWYKGINALDFFLFFLSLWGLGNMCAIVLPGQYQPYYYHLVWPSVSILFSVYIHELVTSLHEKSKQKVVTFLALLISVFFALRIIIFIPVYYEYASQMLKSSVFNQPESFQDPVLSKEKPSDNRPAFLQIADVLNSLAPDKQSTIYILNLYTKGNSGLTPLSYIYAKRYPPTSIECGLLQIPNILGEKIKTLKHELTEHPPDVLVIGNNITLHPFQAKLLPEFLNWFNNFIYSNYKFESSFTYVQAYDNNKTEVFNVFKKSNSDIPN